MCHRATCSCRIRRFVDGTTGQPGDGLGGRGAHDDVKPNRIRQALHDGAHDRFIIDDKQHGP
jgi:hypothetical protein